MKTIFVTGGTGNQGGAVATSLQKNGFIIKVLTRNPDSVRAKELRKRNVEIVKGDLNEVNSFREHLKDIDGIFSVQTFENGIHKEIKQGIDLVNLAMENGIKHFLYSSVAGADLNTGIPHFESKYKIENHVRQSGLPYTIIRANSLFENFLIPQVKNRIVKGKLVSPVNGNKIQQFISAMDIGEISTAIFQNREKYLGKTITIASEQMDMEQVANTFSEMLDKKITYQKLPMLITRLVMGKDLFKMFKWINHNDAIFMKNLEQFKKGNPDLISLNQWIKLNFGNKG